MWTRQLDADWADEFDRTLGVYYQDWLDQREEHRLKRVLSWFMGGEESKGKTAVRKDCAHERFKQDGDELVCLSCGERGN